jgi:hypothetical protein
MKALLLAVALFACGPSAAELKTAKETTYQMKPTDLLELAQNVARDQYKIGDVDEGHYAFATQPNFYSPEGDLESPGAGGFLNLVDRSVKVSFTVQVVELGGGDVAVTVTPKTFQYLKGSPQLRELAPDDLALPPWVHGRADDLALAIYKAAKPHAYPQH